MTHFQDFDECGKVYRCIREEPNLSDSEIARRTRLLPERVATLRSIIQYGVEHYKPIKAPAPNLPKIADKENALEQHIEDDDWPVKIGSEYTSRIQKVSPNGVGIALVNGFTCHIAGAGLGELVKFRIKSIETGSCEAELVRVLQKSPNPTTIAPTVEQISIPVPENMLSEAEKSGKRCVACNLPITEEYYELHDGLCKQCSYRQLYSEAAKTTRRSGTLGADRAGTW